MAQLAIGSTSLVADTFLFAKASESVKFCRTKMNANCKRAHIKTYVRTHASARERMIDLVTFQAGINFGNGTTISLPYSGSSKILRIAKRSNVPDDSKKPPPGVHIYRLAGGARRCKAGVLFHNYELTRTCGLYNNKEIEIVRTSQYCTCKPRPAFEISHRRTFSFCFAYECRQQHRNT